MADSLKVNTKQFLAMGEELEFADKKVKLALNRAIRAASKGVGVQIVDAYGAELPQKGGLAARVRSQAKVATIVRLNSGVLVQIREAAGMRMALIEKGLIRHPVFPDVLHKTRKEWNWAPQIVAAGIGRRTFVKASDGVQDQILKEVDQVLKEI